MLGWRASDRLSDKRLLQRARDGDADAFARVYRRHCEVVLAFLAKHVSQPELAADLMAETFAGLLVVVRDQERALPEVPLAWLFLTARHLLIDSYRRGEVENAARRRLAMQPIVLDDRDLERVVEISAEVDLLETLAARLSPDQVMALRARVFDEREYGDIAKDLRCSELVIRKRVSRALDSLRSSLEASNHA